MKGMEGRIEERNENEEWRKEKYGMRRSEE